MSDTEPISLFRPLRGTAARTSRQAPQGAPAHFPPPGRKTVFFNRKELNAILALYGRMVAAGEWRDYAIDANPETACFAVYRRASEMPLYRIEKCPKRERRQGAYAVIAPGGRILKRGHELAQVLGFFNRKLLRLVDGK